MPLLAVRGNGPVGAYGFGAVSAKSDAMTAIASTTLGTDTATVTFSSIPATYDDLVVIMYARAVTADQTLNCRFNSDTNSNYSTTGMRTTGSVANTSSATNATFAYVAFDIGVLNGTDKFSALTLNVFNYANTSYNKTYLTRHSADNAGTGGVEFNAGLWRSTSAINSITLTMSFGSFRANSAFELYGVKKAV